MTREECIGLLKRYAEYNSMGIPNLAGCKEAMRMAVDLLSQPSFPSNLDEAAESYSENILANGEDMFDAIADGFRARAEWMAGQGETEIVKVDVNGMNTPIVYLWGDKWKKYSGDKVIVQIRKK